MKVCQDVEKEDLARNKEMSKKGAEWILEKAKRKRGDGAKVRVMTVCNTGSLATSVSTRCLF